MLVLPIPDQPASQPIDSRVESLITEEADNTPPPLPMASEPTCNGVPGSRVLVLPIPDQSASQPIISQAAVVESLETEQLDFPSPPHELSPKPVAPESSATETMLVCVDTDLPAPSLSTAATSATPGLSKSDAVVAASMQRARSLYTALVQASMQTTDLSLATGVNNGSIINPTADAHTTSDTFPTNSATDESRSHRVDSGERDRQLDESTILFQRDATTSYFNVQRNSDLLALDSSNIRLTTLPVDYESPDIESNPPVGSLLALLVANDSLPPPPADVLDSRAHCATKDSKRNRRITPCRVLLLLALGILVCALVGVCGVAGRCHRRISNDTSATILSNSTTTTSSYADRATGGDAARTNGTLPTSTMPYITKSSFTSLSELKMSVDAFLLGSESVVPIAEWDVVAITDFSHLFDADRTGVDTFNENLSGWDVSSALSLDGMFYGQVNFLGTGLAVWDVSNVVSMRGTFELASSFNADLSNWDVSNVKYMSYLFAESAFAGDLSSWKVDHVTDTSFLFFGLTKFNSDLSAWHVDRVVDMAYMFNECTGFRNRDLSKWKTSNVLTMAQMFEQSSFIGDISTWDTSHVVTMESMFDRSAFQGDISEWDVSNVENMDRMFRGSRFNRDLSKWNVSKVTSMYKT